jgi:hypothetical protein
VSSLPPTCSAGLMATLPAQTWIRLGVWFAVGLVIFLAYSAAELASAAPG